MFVPWCWVCGLGVLVNWKIMRNETKMVTLEKMTGSLTPLYISHLTYQTFLFVFSFLFLLDMYVSDIKLLFQKLQ